jgi:hypothetical protein
MTPGFLLDEHLPRWWRKEIIRRDPSLEVWRVGDPHAPALSIPDPDILTWCETHNFYLITNNRKSMPKHLADHLARGQHVPGILVVDPDSRIEEVAEDLSLIAGAAMEAEFRDHIRFLPVT